MLWQHRHASFDLEPLQTLFVSGAAMPQFANRVLLHKSCILDAGEPGGPVMHNAADTCKLASAQLVGGMKSFGLR